MVILAISCSVSKLIAGISRGFLGVTIIAEGIIVSSMILAIDANFWWTSIRGIVVALATDTVRISLTLLVVSVVQVVSIAVVVTILGRAQWLRLLIFIWLLLIVLVDRHVHCNWATILLFASPALDDFVYEMCIIVVILALILRAGLCSDCCGCCMTLWVIRLVFIHSFLLFLLCFFIGISICICIFGWLNWFHYFFLNWLRFCLLIIFN